MIWNDHSKDVPEGAHAFLSPSQYHWLNYDEDKLIAVYKNKIAAQQGTIWHKYAHDSIVLGQKLPRSKRTLNSFVNDAIGFRMRSEQTLYFSENAFGTADAIKFENKFLRIHDLKTGATPASMHQLEVYAALFCLEYNVNPETIEIELRIYQNDDVVIGNPEGTLIKTVMDKIVENDKIIERIKNGEL